MSLTGLEIGEAIKQGQIDAIRCMSKAQYQTIFRHQPEMVSKEFAGREYKMYELLDKGLNVAWAITLNIGNCSVLEDFMTTVDKLERKLQKKRIYDEWWFVVERAPKTGRLHIHLRVHMSPRANQRYACVVVHDTAKMMETDTNFIHVKPIHDELGWREYMSKDIVLQRFSKTKKTKKEKLVE